MVILPFAEHSHVKKEAHAFHGFRQRRGDVRPAKNDLDRRIGFSQFQGHVPGAEHGDGHGREPHVIWPQGEDFLHRLGQVQSLAVRVNNRGLPSSLAADGGQNR